MIILLFGPPGCGKGTQAAFINSRYGIPAISTGEMFRAECQAGTKLGKTACTILSSGGLVGDPIVNEILAQRIARPDCRRGFLLDGYPRTLPQAQFLGGLLRERRLPAPQIVHLDVPAGEVVSRLSARRQCPACKHIYNLIFQPPRRPGICDEDGATLVRREDDREEVIRHRLQEYEESTGPVLRYYSNADYFRVDGTRAAQAVSEEIEEALADVLAGCV